MAIENAGLQSGKMTRADFVKTWIGRPEHKTRCFYCGRKFRNQVTEHSPFRYTREHLVSQMEMKGTEKNQCAFNTIGACGGCNNAKNGCTIGEFREWFRRPFYCEWLLGFEYPYEDNSFQGDGRRHMHLERMVDRAFKSIMKRINKRINSKHLTRKLNAIIREAQSSLPVPRL